MNRKKDVILRATVALTENYKKEEVDPDEEGITCTWYKCNDDERKEIGKGKSYTIDSVEQNDFYDEDSNIRYRCIIKKMINLLMQLHFIFTTEFMHMKHRVYG